MRRKRNPEHANHERWLVSYADFITLLFAFFVMMYATSNKNVQQAERISKAFREAAEQGRISHALAKLLKEERPIATTLSSLQNESSGKENTGMELMPSLRQLNERLKKEIDAGRLELRMEKRGLIISLREATFFPSGGDILEPSTRPTLEVIANEIRKHPNPIRLEGHTDSIPIHTLRFRSNWDLSAARGIAMLELFAEQFSIEPNRMAIAGFADTAPVASNDTADGRARNRRVDIVVLNEIAALQEPAQQKK